MIEAMTPEQFSAALKAKGWTQRMLAQRWGLSERRIGQIKADTDRPRYYDDALKGLPVAKKS